MLFRVLPSLAIWSGLLLSTFAYTTPTSMCSDGCNPISKPGLDEAIPAGKPYTVTWQPTTSGTVTILLIHGASSNMEKLYAIAEQVSNSGTFTWTPKSDLEADVTHYGLQLINDDDGTYQYSTQFGISNSNPAAKASKSAASAKASATTSTKTKSTLVTSSVISSSATTFSSSTPTATHSVTSTTTSGTATSQAAAATGTTEAKTAAASDSSKTSGITKAWNSMGNGAKIGIVIGAAVVVIALAAILSVLIHLCRRRTHAVPVYTSLPGGGTDTAYHR